MQEQTAAFAALAQREAALSDLIADTEKDLSEYNGVLNDLTLRADDLKNKVLSFSENEDVLNKIRSEAAAELSKQQAECDELKKERDALSERHQNLRMEGASLASANAAEEANVNRMQEEKQSLARKIDQTRENIAKTEETIQNLRRDEERAALTEEEQKIVSSLRSRIAEVEEEKRNTYSRQLELGEAKRAILSEQQSQSDLKFKCELEISKIETGLENWKQRIDEAYGLTYESAVSLRDENYDITQSYSSINSLKRRISDLGPVNQNAEEDYDNLYARYSEMLTQKEDLDRGIEDLTTILTDLRNEMQKQFDEGFNAINDNFTHIFKELFGGGRAEMQLDYTDCDDPLNAGIEIVACPPGKKLTKISLLSGGERAFTAIAILFAILKARPMPFCILDEIEAALDEANVDRFAKYLKKFSKETQFIVITHRKPTMNQADSLFGVTMEEKGVSKIVSVKLSEVEAKLGGDTVMA